MGSRYTSADIEVHLSDVTDGWETSQTDTDATNARYQEMVEAALAEAYPEYSIAVYGDQLEREVVGYPDALADAVDEIMAVVDQVYEQHMDEFTVALAPTEA